MMIWMLYLDSSHFSDQFRHIIYEISIFRFKDINYSILIEKRPKNKIILLLFEFNIIITYIFIVVYLSNCLEFKNKEV